MSVHPSVSNAIENRQKNVVYIPYTKEHPVFNLNSQLVCQTYLQKYINIKTYVEGFVIFFYKYIFDLWSLNTFSINHLHRNL